MAIIKFINNKVSLKKTLDYICKEEKTENRLISGINCNPDTAYEEMMYFKEKYNKFEGKDKIHFIQSFDPKDKLSYEIAHKIGIKMAEYFKEYQVVVATHQDTNHIHNHIVLNSVNMVNGKKFHQSKADLVKIKEYSDKLCEDYGLTVTKNKAKVDDIKINEYKARQKDSSWKLDLEKAILFSMEKANTKKEFFKVMNSLGYKVTWTKERKNITYIAPNGYKCRDRKLHNEQFLKENMEQYFSEKIKKKVLALKKENNKKTYKGMALNIAEIIEQFKRRNENDYTPTLSSYSDSAKKQFAIEMHYSTEELEDMEL